jgi:hypothetical protein
MRKIAFLLALLSAGTLISESASAHGRARVGVGFVFGGPFWHPWYYAPPPYYYYPPPYTVYSSPPVYIERQDTEPTPAAADWWYYCEQSKGYYPYVKTCPGGWQKVPPTPPS